VSRDTSYEVNYNGKTSYVSVTVYSTGTKDTETQVTMVPVRAYLADWKLQITSKCTDNFSNGYETRRQRSEKKSWIDRLCQREAEELYDKHAEQRVSRCRRQHTTKTRK